MWKNKRSKERKDVSRGRERGREREMDEDG